MSKRKIKPELFEDSDDDEKIPESKSNFQVNDKYATAYDKWRQKEELQKLKDRYGDVSLAENDEDEETSSEEDENPYEDITPAEERDFFKKLAIIKRGDYHSKPDDFSDDSANEEKKFPVPSSSTASSSKKSKNKPMFLKDYERQLILEREGRLSDEDDDVKFSPKLTGGSGRNFKTYTEEQNEIKESFKSAFKGDDDDDFLRARQKTAQEQAKEEDDYVQWLKGKKDVLSDEKTVKDLKPLRDYWRDPNLNEGERFLRDYILNRRYLEEEDDDDDDRIPSYDEIVNEDRVGLEEDEEELDRQEQFEHKYNFRFEEPDAEFVKTYPRTVGDSLRRKDEKRKQQRDDYKKRKEEEKKIQVEEVKQLKNLKRREIMEKLEKLRRTAGSEQLELKMKELEDDFDPQEYDRMMQKAFGDNYYTTNEHDEEKPQFSDIEDDPSDGESTGGDLANWDDWAGDVDQDPSDDTADAGDDDKPGPSTSKKGRFSPEDISEKKKRKRSVLAEALLKKKPVFDPAEKKFEQYFDDYYKMDFEDLIGGDIRCRFKYRKVEPNDFGLSVQEVLSAQDKELNAWVSVKKMSQYRTKDEEVYDQKAYHLKNRDKSKKKRLLPSVYGEETEKTADDGPQSSKSDRTVQLSNETMTGGDVSNKKKKKKKKKPKKKNVDEKKPVISADVVEKKVNASTTKKVKKRGKKKKPDETKNDWDRKTNLVEQLSNERLAAYGVNAKKLKNRVKYSTRNQY